MNMKTKFKKLLFIWLGVGIILTSILYFIERDQHRFTGTRTYSSIPSMPEDYTLTTIRTYYEYVGVITVGGALLILGLGFKE